MGLPGCVLILFVPACLANKEPYLQLLVLGLYVGLLGLHVSLLVLFAILILFPSLF